jgi:DNA-binding NtrC family response regulator
LNGGFAGNNNYGDEREILYRILFDMRNDISELKRMVAELSHGNIIPSTGHTRGGNEVFGLLPSSSSEIHEPSRTITDTTYSEDVTEITRSAPQTKEEMLREAIVAALKRSNGRRKEAAQSLFMSERTLYRRIKEFGIDEKDLS